MDTAPTSLTDEQHALADTLLAMCEGCLLKSPKEKRSYISLDELPQKGIQNKNAVSISRDCVMFMVGDLGVIGEAEQLGLKATQAKDVQKLGLRVQFANLTLDLIHLHSDFFKSLVLKAKSEAVFRQQSRKSKATKAARLLVLLLLTPFLPLLLIGCTSKHPGAPVVGNSGRLIDNSWVTATNACWPDLRKQGYTADDIRHNLANTTDLHNAFPVYGAQTHKDLDDILGKPLQAAPDPDTSQLAHSQTPVLTRGQAAEGTVPQMAVVQHTNGIAPPDSFCSIQTGIPQGFSK